MTLLQITADSIAPSGHGVGTTDGLEVQVIDLLPGESAACSIEHRSQHKNVAWARIQKRTSALSEHRVSPHCPAFGRCGGCAWQHLSYPEQLRAKHATLEKVLARSVAPPIASQTTAYRNVGKYVPAKIGSVVGLGAYLPRTHEFVSTLGCQAVVPSIDAVAKVVARALEDGAISLYDEKKHTGCLRHVVIRAGEKGIYVSLVTAEPGDVVTLATQIITRSTIPIEGISEFRNEKQNNLIFHGSPNLAAGAPTLGVQTYDGIDIALPPNSFWQVNTPQAHKLVSTVKEWTADATGVLDLFCGAGAISLPLAKSGISVQGFDITQTAIEAANQAAARHHLDAHYTVSDLYSISPEQNIDTWICNPPRKGLGNKVTAAILKCAPSNLVYISCNPTSLANDLVNLARVYQVQKIQSFDFMPGTPHIETAALLHIGNK